MGAPVGPIACWTDRQLRYQLDRLESALDELRAKPKAETVDVVVKMWPGWRPRAGQKRVHFAGEWGELLVTVWNRSPRVVLARFGRNALHLKLMLKIAAAADTLDVRAGKGPSRLLHAVAEPKMTAAQRAWLRRARARNEATDQARYGRQGRAA